MPCLNATEVGADLEVRLARRVRAANEEEQAREDCRDAAGTRALQGEGEREVSLARCTAMLP